MISLEVGDEWIYWNNNKTHSGSLARWVCTACAQQRVASGEAVFWDRENDTYHPHPPCRVLPSVTLSGARAKASSSRGRDASSRGCDARPPPDDERHLKCFDFECDCGEQYEMFVKKV